MEQEFLLECKLGSWAGFFEVYHDPHNYIDEPFLWCFSNYEEVWTALHYEWLDILEEVGYEEHLSNP